MSLSGHLVGDEVAENNSKKSRNVDGKTEIHWEQ